MFSAFADRRVGIRVYRILPPPEGSFLVALNVSGEVMFETRCDSMKPCAGFRFAEISSGSMLCVVCCQ